MPTTEDNPGTSRCEISSIGRGYEAGYDDGLQLSRSEGERHGWEMAIEAAAEYHDKAAGALRKYAQKTKGVHSARRGIRKAQRHEEYAAAIRKLRKE